MAHLCNLNDICVANIWDKVLIVTIRYVILSEPSSALSLLLLLCSCAIKDSGEFCVVKFTGINCVPAPFPQQIFARCNPDGEFFFLFLSTSTWKINRPSIGRLLRECLLRRHQRQKWRDLLHFSKEASINFPLFLLCPHPPLPVHQPLQSSNDAPLACPQGPGFA